MINFNKTFYILSYCFLLWGCSGPVTTASKIYNSAFSTSQEVDCPEAKFIKGMEFLKRYNDDSDLLYTISFNKIEWSCYLKDENNVQSYYIELNTSFSVNYEDENKKVSVNNFEYVIAVLDLYDRPAVSEKYLYDFEETGLFNFKNDKSVSIKMNIEKVGILSESSLLLGFIN
ncbi:MAG: hypothetical protein CMJ14_00550 [Pelagibacterales bacterium]|nr:hypothetical protein [Pelagibacterales bacterium]|tara:strand:- start:845 stop:1363 length:519 start_codon:yes stop_codon:yes gene_type:complete